jgi:hypothetical protein
MDFGSVTSNALSCLGSLLSALPLVFFAWSGMLLEPFIGFTFTDPADFIFVTLIPVTLLGIAWQHRRPGSDAWLRFAKAIAYALVLLGPLVPLMVLYLASWRASVLLGHWPRYMIDDPKNICQQDAIYKSLCSGVSYANAFAGWSIISVGALLLHLRRRISPMRLVGMAVMFFLAWMLFVGEPGGRYAWWLD